jgi:hypothetical protein
VTNKHVDNVLTHVQRISVGIDNGLLEDETTDFDFLTPPTSPTTMQMALLTISNPDWCMTHEQVDGHEFLFHSRTLSSRLEPQTCLSQTSPAHSPSKRHHSEVDLDDDHPADIPVNPFPDPAPRS